MKKLLGFMVAAVGLLPFVVNAGVEVVEPIKCTTASDGVTVECEVVANITSPVTSLELTLTEEGGADVMSVVETEDWDLSKSESNGVHTVALTSASLNPLQGEVTLFNVTYKKSGEVDCKVRVRLDGAEYDIEPPAIDEPTDNKETGATLPYIALGAIALVTIGAYVVTKNKSKMYRI